jgi:hypothetical protein
MVVFCSHRKISFPMTVWRHAPPTTRYGKRTYVICLGCGKEFAYSWEEMRIEVAEPAGFGLQQIITRWLYFVCPLAMRALARIVPSQSHLPKPRFASISKRQLGHGRWALTARLESSDRK